MKTQRQREIYRSPRRANVANYIFSMRVAPVPIPVLLCPPTPAAMNQPEVNATLLGDRLTANRTVGLRRRVDKTSQT